MKKGFFELAVVSGLCGSLSSLSGKLCFDRDSTAKLIGLISEYGSKNNVVVTFVRVLSGVMLVLFNMIMTSYYTRAMDISDNSLHPTIVNFSSNFLFTVKTHKHTQKIIFIFYLFTWLFIYRELFLFFY